MTQNRIRIVDVADTLGLSSMASKESNPSLTTIHQEANLRQHRTIPALRLKHRSGSCGTASAAPRSPYRHLELCGIALRAKTAIECLEAMRDGTEYKPQIVLPVDLIKRESTRKL